ncbi:MAG: elongation factor G [Prochloraceae cyanobacterium]|nr:elongation factor G [Prochloraceae cyanobacterium]
MVPRGRIRNIGISAHIDAGKTTLSERILYYSGKIHKIEEVRGSGRGATMDSMAIEKDKGITIASAAITCNWNDTKINLIDTPGHVDFTIEVERSLRVLDGAIMVLCAVAGVQSQSITVDRQMKRYRVPRIAFINKMDREGANPFAVVKELKEKLGLNPVLLQYPIAVAGNFIGIIDLIAMEANYFAGEKGENRISKPIPEQLKNQAEKAREDLLDRISLLSEEITEKLIEGERVSQQLILAALRQGTLKREITPVLMGSAYKNKGVQNLLDGVVNYLPSPLEKELATAVDISSSETVKIYPQVEDPLVALAFKLTDDEFGQLTYTRIYAGTLNKGDRIYNTRSQKFNRVSRLVRMEADKRLEIESATAGDIVALIGVESASGDTLTSGRQIALESIFVPDPVITLSITPKTQADLDRASKALQRFVKEDPTLQVSNDPESNKTLISGMGELHLEIYIERMKREYNANVEVGAPAVAYRETIAKSASFDYLHKKQSGGQGQYARVIGRIEPCQEQFIFESKVFGGAIPSKFLAACEKGFRDAMENGAIEGYPIMGVKIILEGGDYHSVDSSEMAFRFAAKQAFDRAFTDATPTILEPIMLVEVETPSEFIGKIQGDLLSRRGFLLGSVTKDNYAVIRAEVPLAKMFRYSSRLRGLSKGMAAFAMEFTAYRPRS